MSYNFTDKTFCTQPFSNIVISVQGLYKICCMGNDDSDFGHVRDENGNVMHVLDHDIYDVFNSPTFRNHRLDLSQNKEPDRCLNCYDKERSTNGKVSVRLIRNQLKSRIVEIVDINQARSLMKPDGSIDIPPVTLDIRFGNLCNSKCISCNPANSSMWAEDAEKVFGNKYKVVWGQSTENFGASERWWESPKWWTQFEKLAPHLRGIYVIGGEPLIVPEHDTMLEKLVEWGYAKDIELEYDTNLTVVNPKLINLWKKFKNIVLRISIDETEDRYHLIRFPGNWQRLISNIERLRSEGIAISGFTSSIGLATIYSPFRLQQFSDKYNIPYFQRFLYIPKSMAITNLPPSAKEEIIKVYQKNEKRAGIKGMVVSNHLRNYFDTVDISKVTEFVKFMNKLDEIRGTNWRTTLPDVFSLLSRHCPESFV